MTELSIVKSRALRELVSDRTDVLDKVKELHFLPVIDMMTIQQVADYYEVEVRTVQYCYQRNKKEIIENGAVKLSTRDFKALSVQYANHEKTRGYKDFQLSEDLVLRIPTSGIVFFPKRAVLCVGMLIKSSEVAKNVRTLLLRLLETEQTGLTGRPVYETQMLCWIDQQNVNSTVKLIAKALGADSMFVWMRLHERLNTRYGIDLKERRRKTKKSRGRSLISFIKDEEWIAVQQSLVALCEKWKLNSAEVFEKLKEVQIANTEVSA